MEALHSCRCCLRRAPDRGLTTPYTHLGTTEIYSEMLKDCFDIHLVTDINDEYGICSACVGRLRDASAFKLQVQRSQAELQARLERALHVKGEEPSVKLEVVESDKTSETLMLHEEFIIKPDLKDENSSSEDEMLSDEEPAVKSEAPDGGREAREHSCAAPRAGAACASLSTTSVAEGKLCRTLPSGRRPYGCDVCHKQLTTKGSLKRHKLIHSNHTADMPYTCDKCKKQFTCQSRLITHTRTHTGDRPYTCDVCNKTYTQKSHLRMHQRIHTGDKRYTCNICEKLFNQKSHLNAHIRTHTKERPYNCDVCSKTFVDCSALRQHQRIHTGEKPYICNICKKRFTQKSGLIIHIRTHTKERPYNCDVCSKTFADSLALKLKPHSEREGGSGAEAGGSGT